MNDKEKEERVTKLFESIELPKRKRNRKQKKLFDKVSINRWLLITLVIINLLILGLHIYNTMHVQELVEFRRLNGHK